MNKDFKDWMMSKLNVDYVYIYEFNWMEKGNDYYFQVFEEEMIYFFDYFLFFR